MTLKEEIESLALAVIRAKKAYEEMTEELQEIDLELKRRKQLVDLMIQIEPYYRTEVVNEAERIVNG